MNPNDPNDPNALPPGADPNNPDGQPKPWKKQPQPDKSKQDRGNSGGGVDGVFIADAGSVADAAGVVGDGVGAIAEGAGEAAGGALDAAGTVLEGAGAVLEGAGAALEGAGGCLDGCSCSIALLFMACLTAGTAFALFK